jgi:hypothetical protein
MKSLMYQTFIFFGPSPTMFVNLNEEDIEMMNRLLLVFEEEFTSVDDIKGEMLRMLLVRLIIKVTRLAKKQYLGTEEVVEATRNSRHEVCERNRKDRTHEHGNRPSRHKPGDRHPLGW